MSIILLLASVQAFFLAALLFSKHHKNLSDMILGTWLLLIGVHTLIIFSFLQFQFQNTYVLNINAGFPFLQGPFLYFYVDTLTSMRTRLRRSYLLHFLPYLIFVSYHLFVLNPFSITAQGRHVVIHLFSLPGVFNVLLLASVPVYMFASLILLKRYRARILNNFSAIDKINLNWLRYLITALGVVWIIVVVAFLQTKLMGQSHLIFIAITLFVYATGYFGFKQTAIFSDVALLEGMKHEKQLWPVPGSEKYLKSGLKDEEARKTLNRLLAYMDNDQPYLDPQLSLSKLAGDLEVSVNHLSQIINEHCRQNFFDFVNSYRVEDVKKKLQHSEYEAYSLLAIGLECGFGSKSSFNRIFRTITGQTPTQYKNGLKKS